MWEVKVCDGKVEKDKVEGREREKERKREQEREREQIKLTRVQNPKFWFLNNQPDYGEELIIFALYSSNFSPYI